MIQKVDEKSLLNSAKTNLKHFSVIKHVRWDLQKTIMNMWKRTSLRYGRIFPVMWIFSFKGGRNPIREYIALYATTQHKTRLGSYARNCKQVIIGSFTSTVILNIYIYILYVHLNSGSLDTKTVFHHHLSLQTWIPLKVCGVNWWKHHTGNDQG